MEQAPYKVTCGDVTGDGQAEIIGYLGQWHLVLGCGRIEMDQDVILMCLLETSQQEILQETARLMSPQSGAAACGIRMETPLVGQR